MTTSEAEVWVRAYTTSTGVHVAAHPRRSTARGTAHDPAATAMAVTTSLADPHPSPSVGSPDLAAAEARYRAAVVAVGVSSLRQRNGRPTDLAAALQDRAQARAEMEAARKQISEQPTATTSDGFAAAAEPADRCPSCGQYRDDAHQCPTPSGLPAGDYAGLKGEERVKAMVADLESSVQAIVESGQLRRWLDAMASNGLNRWSANNRILAAVQLLQRGESLDNMHLMGFRQWEAFNRRVSKGAKAVWILAPVTRKVLDEDDNGNTTERRRVVGFKGVAVFNVADTEGEPLASAPGRAAQGEATPGTLQGLRDRVALAGYIYEETQIPDCRPATGEGTLGYTEPSTKRIVVDSRLSEAQKASTIAHELGHVHCGHVDQDPSEYRRHRGRMETEAEMTAYLVNRSRGMSRDQIDAFSPGYIASWSRGDPAVIHQALGRSTAAYNKIIDGSWPTTTGARS